MAIIQKMMIVTLALGFWTTAVMGVTSLVPRTKGTLLDCKLNQMMDQPICKPFTMKLKTRIQ